MRIYVGALAQYLFPLIGVDDVIFAPPDDKLCEYNGVVYFLVCFPISNGICAKGPVYESGNKPDVIFITETP